MPSPTLPLAEVRRRVVVSETDPRLFTGRCATSSTRAGGHDDAERPARRSRSPARRTSSTRCRTASTRGRGARPVVLGGQRQRLALARALLTDAETLVLVEPTSAVDAHTEARIAERLGAARAGRTTVVMTASPLLLDHADHVVFLRDGGSRRAAPTTSCWTTTRPTGDVVIRGEDELMALDHRRRRRRTLPVADVASVRRAHRAACSAAPRDADRSSSACTRSPRWPRSPRPRLIGQLVDAVDHRPTRRRVDRLSSCLAVACSRRPS